MQPLMLGAVRRRGSANSHRYWRFNITATNGSALYVLAQEVQLASTVGGSNLATGGSANASSSVFGSPGQAFDNNLSTAWQTSWSNPQWLSYDFGGPRSIAEVRIYSAGSGFEDRNFGAFDVQYSDDNSTWFTAHSFTFSGWVANTWSSFTL